MMKAAKGISLMEVALAMAIVGVLVVSVASLVRTGIEAQQQQRASELMQVAATNIVDDLRFDLLAADESTMAVSANQLRFTNLMTGSQVQYQLSGNQMRRTEKGATKVYNDVGLNSNGASLLNISCINSCFQLRDMGGSQKIWVEGLTIQTNVPDNSIIGNRFGNPQYTLQDIHFDLTTSKVFQ